MVFQWFYSGALDCFRSVGFCNGYSIILGGASHRRRLRACTFHRRRLRVSTSYRRRLWACMARPGGRHPLLRAALACRRHPLLRAALARRLHPFLKAALACWLHPLLGGTRGALSTRHPSRTTLWVWAWGWVWWLEAWCGGLGAALGKLIFDVCATHPMALRNCKWF